MEFCAETGLCVGNTYFKYKGLQLVHKGGKRPRWSGGKEHDRSGTGKEDMLHFVYDVSAVRGMGQGISDHHVVLCKVRLVGTWIKRRQVVDGTRMIRSEKLWEHQRRIC